MPARVWCWTPNPVLEIKFTHGQRAVSAGGKGHNVARQLRAWQLPAVSVVSEPGSDWLQAARQDRVPIREIPIRSSARTGWAVVEAAGQRLDFFTEDPPWKAADWNRCGLFFRRMVRRGDWLVVAGSSAKGWPKGWWKKLIGDLQKKGVTVLVDSRGALLREAVQAGADWIKCNLAEAEETTGMKGVQRCIRNLAGNGTTGVVVTLGKDGLVAEVNGVRFLIAAPKVRVADATGSGDVVTAALVAGELQQRTIDRTLRRAVEAASRHAASGGMGKKYHALMKALHGRLKVAGPTRAWR